MNPQKMTNQEKLNKDISKAIMAALDDNDISIEEIIGVMEHIKHKIQSSAFSDSATEIKTDTIEGYR